MQLMCNHVRSYAWGSRTAIPTLLGQPPASEPQAELWIGAHPGDPSVLEDNRGKRTLLDAIDGDPLAQVGPAVMQRFGPRLPFLLKVLAADEPLSLQAHPSARQAAAGFPRENAAGVPLGSPMRNYKDASPKPEMICALTEFHALCGFRDAQVTLHLLTALNVERLNRYLPILADAPNTAGIARLFSTLMELPATALIPLLTDVVAGCRDRVDVRAFAPACRTVLQLAHRYDRDAGVLVSLLMNRVTLAPGQGLYLPAGRLHSYLSGTGVEIMANSDNVLRGGLTAKHVDVPELTAVLDFHQGDVTVINGVELPDGERWYPTPTPEFRFSRIEVTGGRHRIDHAGPQILLVVAGQITAANSTGRTLTVPPGHSLWIPASDRGGSITGHGTVFRAVDGLPTSPDPDTTHTDTHHRAGPPSRIRHEPPRGDDMTQRSDMKR